MRIGLGLRGDHTHTHTHSPIEGIKKDAGVTIMYRFNRYYAQLHDSGILQV